MRMRLLEVADKTLRSRRLKTAIRGLFLRLTLRFALVKLRRESNQRKSVEEYVDLAFGIFSSFPFGLWNIAPRQVSWEIARLLRILAKHKPKFVLEIGTAGGGTLFLLAKVSSPDALMISMDLPAGRLDVGYSELKAPFYKSFATNRQKIYLIRGDSHASDTFIMVEKILCGNMLDFLLIDGDHTYEGVRKDFELYSRLVKKRGMVAFHDIVPGPPENVGGVPRFWSEVKHGFRYVELVKDWEQGVCGLGVLQL